MIPTLYKAFQHWSKEGGVYLISDPHLGDSDCLLMDENWLPPEEYVKRLAAKVHRSDTLICLGDVGDITYLQNAWKMGRRPYSVLVMGNHDESATNFEGFFDEIYTGPLTIAKKIILSHEPLDIDWALNIHGHDHNKNNRGDKCHLNLAANVVNYTVANLKEIIGGGALKNIKDIHRQTIDEASK